MNVNKININQSEPTYYIESGAYDVTANNSGITFSSLSTLLSSENLSTLIPSAVRCGGMSIRFVQSSDNKYVQYHYMETETTGTPNPFLNTANWQGVKNVITNSDNNIPSSKAVYDYVRSYGLRKETIQDSNDDIRVYDDEENIVAKVNKNGVYTKKFFTLDGQEIHSGVKSIRILSVGNSFAEDILSYVPPIINEIAPDVYIKIGVLYIGGCTLETHLNMLRGNSAYSQLSVWNNEEGRWYSTPTVTLRTALEDEWDVILFQQQSSRSRDYTTYQPYLNQLIDEIYQYLVKPVKFGWILTQAYAEGFRHNAANEGLIYYDETEDTSNSMFEKQIACAQRVLTETAVDFVLPAGTALQDARTVATLDELGNFSSSQNNEDTYNPHRGHLTADGMHLQEGLPCLIVAYPVVIKICEMLGIPNGIYGSTFVPDASLYVPNPHGGYIGLTTANLKLAQKIAYIATKKPYEITNITNLNL